jgi:hypothetical protein
MFFNATANIWFYLRGVNLRRLRTQQSERGAPATQVEAKAGVVCGIEGNNDCVSNFS